jgi:hypothetical protein
MSDEHEEERKPPRRWPTKPVKPDAVKITRPDPETGEVIEITRAESTVKTHARAARRDGAPPNLLEITAEERRKLIAGKLNRLIRKARLPDVDAIVEEKGEYVYIVSWDQLKSFADPETKTKLTPDAHPACWVTVTGEPKIAKGKGWAYELKVERHDRDRPDPLLKAKAGYTRDRSQAIDPDAPPVLTGKDLDKIEMDARMAQAQRREADEADRTRALRMQIRGVREELNDVVKKLSPAAQQALLAGIHRLLKEALDAEAEQQGKAA